MFNGSLEMARRQARENNRWLLVSVHAPTDFASQAMNRDLWNSSLLQSFIKENFVFVQLIVGGSDERRYQSFYPYDGLYPHVALIDPRTGERVETLLVASIPVPGFKLIPSDRDMLELLGEFIADHPMETVGDQRKRSTSSPKLERGTLESEPELKRSFISDETARDDNISASTSDLVIPDIVPNYEGSDAIQVQFRLPSGQKHRHRFNPKSKASEVFQTAAAVSQTPLNSFKLSTAEGELNESSNDISKLHNTMLTIIK
jgi:UBX domain-containing protein 7